MSHNNSIDFTISGIGSILKEKNLVVPCYQRSYAWESRHIEDLYKDIETAISEGRKEYFLGSIVLLEDKRSYQVVDGQQRLATCSILIAAIRDYLIESKDAARATSLESDYLLSQNRRTQELQPNLTLNTTDNDFFLKFVLKYENQKRKKTIETGSDSHKNIKKAAELARRHVKNLAQTRNDPSNHLMDWLDFLDKQAKVIRVQVPDGANAFTIFETLNDRGLDLAISDLLKNFLFNRAGDRINEAQHYWSAMTSALSAVEAEKYTISYIRHMWSTQQGLTRERELYESIRSRVTSMQSAIDTACLFGEGAKVYAAILNPNHEVWNAYSHTTRMHMATLNLLRMTQVRPLILAALQNFNKKDTELTLQLLVSLSVRFYILGRLGSSDLEIFYATKAKNITSGEITNYKSLKEASKKDIPSDAQFKEAFITASVGKSYLARYYLCALENQKNRRENSELIANDNPDDVNLEHILPESPSPEWNQNRTTAESYVNRLGNLTLLPTSENSNIGNQPFENKKAVYSRSKLSITREISEYERWDFEAIMDRQRKLADLAVATWQIR
ncbi:MAG: DUF262 domain-containing HNH endonuclease family protein [Verrucomicrobiota bacterium JB022]|nr:DUF262 domain-containing HNH endonuclease family protein [Verrucomicrobiota bacterium JB022]